ncbi:MAG: hypothetical protein HWQ41_08130 [Nostoc sp. NOS(2021)]|uniref:hypothetical protein n=1 Tax=Nostoc sp. NOS(2021) TaxID=2815407 RepID=UPI0025E7482A|nr:hypothetical protein [Nostoc sp. NOS(2021)]MBN3895223.1 hypothetical protein [Nostoc sp. NOS(2021)]
MAELDTNDRSGSPINWGTLIGIDPKDDQGAVASAAKAIAKEYMLDGQSFVWNATNLSRQLRSLQFLFCNPTIYAFFGQAANAAK